MGVVSTEGGRWGAVGAGGTEGRGVEGRRGEGRGVAAGRVEGRGGLVGGRAARLGGGELGRGAGVVVRAFWTASRRD